MGGLRCTKAGASNYIKSYDKFGQSVSFKFGGQPNHKTCPGGFVSMIISGCLLAYTFLQGKYMISRQTWSLIQQNVLQVEKELRVPERLAPHKNVSVAIQFNQKRKSLTAAQMAEFERK